MNGENASMLTFTGSAESLRTSGYALIALLKAESDLADIWLGIHNKPFRDHRHVGLHKLVW